jgi:hypothetical protein
MRELASSSNFDLKLVNPEKQVLLGSRFSFQVSFESPLKKLGWSVSACFVEKGESKLEFLKNGCGIDVLGVYSGATWFQIGSKTVEIFLNSFSFPEGDNNEECSISCEMNLCYSSDGLHPDSETYCSLYSSRTCESQLAQFSLVSSDIFKNK